MLNLNDDRAYFSTTEVLQMLGIRREELYTVMRPSRGKSEEALFKPETEKMGVSCWLFTQKDIVRLSEYFQVYKKYKSVLDDLEDAKKVLKGS